MSEENPTKNIGIPQNLACGDCGSYSSNFQNVVMVEDEEIGYAYKINLTCNNSSCGIPFHTLLPLFLNPTFDLEVHGSIKKKVKTKTKNEK